MLKHYFTFLMLFFGCMLQAAPYNGEIMTFEQPDGTLVEVRIYGDEYYSRCEGLDGYTLIRDPKTDWICYAKLSADKSHFVSTGVHYPNTKKSAGSGLIKHEKLSPSAIKKIAAQNKAQLGASEESQPTKKAAKKIEGHFKGLTIVIDFPDKPAKVSLDKIERMLNGDNFTEDGNNGSVKQYYHDVSNGLVTYENEVIGWYHAKRNFSFYDSLEYGKAARGLLHEVLKWVDEQGFDFSTLSTDANGNILAINMMYTGYPKKWSKGMWYHKGSFNGFSADGVKTKTYNTSPANSPLKIGTICHENGHMLCGWPDTYKYHGGEDGIGSWDLMCTSGAKSPPPPNPLFRMQAGWTTATELAKEAQTVTCTANDFNIYKYTNPSDPKEYFLIENVMKTGRYKGYPDQGLAIWHIDKNGSHQARGVEKQVVTIEHAFNTPHNNKPTCYSSRYINEFNRRTAPSSNWRSGQRSDLRIFNVGPVGEQITFDMDFEESDMLEKAAMQVLNVKAISTKKGFKHSIDKDPYNSAIGTVSTSKPLEITYDLGTVYDLKQLQYLPRHGDGKSAIQQYTIYISNDLENWGEAAATGTWEATQLTKVTDLSATGRYLKLVGVSNPDEESQISIAELYMFGNVSATSKPTPAFEPYPSQDAVLVATEGELKWEAGIGSTEHLLYLSTDPQIDKNDLVGTLSEPLFTYTELQKDKTYFWRVDEKNANGIIKGETWRFRTTTENVALNKTATVSSVHLEYTADFATDGDNFSNKSRWVSSRKAEYPHWIEVDLGETFNINHIKLYTGWNGYASPINDFTLQYWDGAEWKEAFAVTKNKEAKFSKTFDPAETSKVRLEVTKSSDDIVRLYEIEIFQAPATDCNGEVGGFAYIDGCGECVGGQTGLEPCKPVTAENTITLNTEDFKHQYKGGGSSYGLYSGHHWALSEDDQKLAQKWLFDEANLQYVQQYFGEDPALESKKYDTFIRYVKQAKEANPDLKVSIVMNNFPEALEVPSDEKGSKKPLNTELEDIYGKLATWYFDVLQYFHDNGVKVDIINLVNEPDFGKKGYYGISDQKKAIAMIAEHTVTKLKAILADAAVNKNGLECPKIMAPSTLSPYACLSYIKEWKSKYPKAWANVDIVATHQYAGGSGKIDIFKKITAQLDGRGFIQSEQHTNRGDGIGSPAISKEHRGVLSLGQVFSAAVGGGVESWWYFQTNYPQTHHSGGLIRMSKGKAWRWQQYYAFKQLNSTQPKNSHIIGQTKHDVSGIYSVAFRKKGTDKAIVHLTNKTGNVKGVTLNLNDGSKMLGIKSFKVWKTNDKSGAELIEEKTFENSVKEYLLNVDKYSLTSVEITFDPTGYQNTLQAQALTFKDLKDKKITDATVDLSAESSSNLPITYEVLEGNATIAGDQLTLTGLGKVTVAAKQNGNEKYQPATSKIQSFYVFPAEENVALDKPATASSLKSTTANTADKAVDGDRKTNDSRWLADDKDEAPQWLEVDLGEAYSISSFAFWTGYDNAYTNSMSNFELQSLEGNEWVTKYSVTGNFQGANIIAVQEFVATKVRLHISKKSNANIRLYELELYGKVSIKENQTITFAELGDQQLKTNTITLEAEATSGLAVTYEVKTGNATISGNELTLNGVGKVTLEASQAGNEQYIAAISVAQSFYVLPGENIALNKPATASSIHSPETGYTADKAFDGDRKSDKSRWLADKNGELPQWIEVDLNGEYVIKGLGFWTGYQSYSQEFKGFELQSFENEEWVTKVTVTNNDSPERIMEVDAFVATKVRLNITEGDHPVVRLYELEIYGEENKTSSNETFANARQVFMYPNLVKDGHAQLKNLEPTDKISVYSIFGKQEQISVSGTKLDLSRLQSGIYILKVNNQSIKFCKQ